MENTQYTESIAQIKVTFLSLVHEIFVSGKPGFFFFFFKFLFIYF